jgi:transcriptional regulator with XRE-family HTH domain
MINNADFAKRLQKVIDFYGESASSFAEKIGVQRSSISHILSGRNKPSLDFILKIMASYPEVELYWLLNGKGSFPNKDTSQSIQNKGMVKEPVQESMISKTLKQRQQEKTIDKIIIFYTDGSFKSYQN